MDRGEVEDKMTEATEHRDKKTERREQILAAATQVLVEKGFNGATTKEIAVRAGIAEGTIFRYFKTKKDILLALIPENAVESFAGVFIELANEPEEVVLKALLKNRLSVVKENFPVVKILLTEIRFHPEIRDWFVENFIMKTVKYMEDYLKERAWEGRFKDFDPRIASRAFIGMIGIFVMWREFLTADKFVAFDEEQVVDVIVDIYLNGIRKNGTSWGGSAVE